MSDDDADVQNVIVLPPPRERMVCSRCTRYIEPGEAFREVRVPDGTLRPIHERCLR
jgi:hypothetical protein